MEQAFFYAVGVGAGNPELLTVQAVRVLQSCAVICFPETAPRADEKHHLAYDAVRGAIDMRGKDVLFFPIPMTRDCAVVHAEYDRIAAICAEHVKHTRSVAFVSIGDVSLYATANHIAERVRSYGVGVRFVAGVNSFSSAACEALLNLAARDESVSIIPGDAFYTEKKLEKALCAEGTKVLMKTGRHLREIIAVIDSCGLLERTTLVQNVSLENQRIILGKEMRHLDEAVLCSSYLSIMIVQGRNV